MYFIQHLHDFYQVEKGLLISGESLEQLVRNAGFADVKLKIVKCESGDWGPGIPSPYSSYNAQIRKTTQLHVHSVSMFGPKHYLQWRNR